MDEVVYKNVMSNKIENEIHSEHRTLDQEENFELMFAILQFINDTVEVLK